MTRSTHSILACAIAGIIILISMSVGFGITGVLAAALTITVFATLPTMYGFAVGQLALAVLAPTALLELLQTPTVIATELGLLLFLWSDLTTPANRNLAPIAIATTVLFAIIAATTFGETESLWQTGGVLLASIVFLAYALHRYTIVFVLEETTP